tara:strand:+ start:763 stop:1878 length:1116 start_codon:yes stop_codon:yes gene_type:complete
MGKKYKVKDINKNGKIDSWEQAKYNAINDSQGPASARFLKRLNNAGGIAGLLQSQPGSQSVLKPNRSVNNMSNMVRQQPRQPMGMDVSTNAQILNQAYDPRMAVNHMQGMAKKGSIGPAQAGMAPGSDFVSEIKSNVTKKPKTKSQKRLEKTKQKAADARKETTSKETAAKGRVSKTKSKTQQKRDKTLRLEKRAKRQEGRQERKEIRKKAREGKMTRGEKRKAIIDSRDKQKGKGPAQVNQVKPTPDNKYGRNPDDYHKDANLNDKYPRRKASDPRSKTHQKNLKEGKGPAQYQVPNPNEKSKKPEPKFKTKSREERRNEEREKIREQIRKETREKMKQRDQEEHKKRNKETMEKMRKRRKKNDGKVRKM